MAFQAAIFDLDGTLLNTLPDLQFITNKTLTDAGFPPRTMEQIEQSVGYGVERLLKTSFPEGTVLPEERMEELYKAQRQNYLDYQNRLTVLYDGIEEMLQELKAMGVKSAIVTNKMNAAARVVVDKYFPGLIDVVVGAQEGFRLKPYPDTGEEALRQLGVKAEDCVYIGDSDTDIETGNNLCMPVLSVTWGFRREDFLRECGAQILIHKPQQIVDFFRYTE